MRLLQSRKHTLKNTLGAALILFAITTSAQAADNKSVPIASFLPADTLQQVRSQLAPNATISNARATFTINSASGQSQVPGTVSMLERINELRAIETLQAMKKTEVYTDALKNSAKAPVKFGKSLVNEPVDTVSNTVKGLGGFFADVGYSIVSDDPSQENVAKTGLGFSTAKRNFAFQLGVNPYSQYQPLQDALGEVAWTATGGGLTVMAAFRAVPNQAGSILSTTSFANTGRVLVRDNSPRKLKNLNEDAMHAMGISEELTETMLDNYNFDPETETRLVTSLTGMKGVAGRADVIGRAALARSNKTATQMRDWIELLAAYHAQVTPAKSVVVLSTALFLVDKDNRVHGVFPTDYVIWTDPLSQQIEATAAAIKAAGYGFGPVTFTGKVDPRVQQLLLDSGWPQVQEYAEHLLRKGQGSAQ